MNGRLIRSSLIKRIVLLAIVIIGFAIWFFPGYKEYRESSILFITPDPYYHARRVQVAINNFPQLPVFDHYLSYPTGGYCIWPPLFDFLAAFMCYTVFLGNPTISQIEWTCAIFPIFFGMMIIFLLYKVGHRLINDKVALLSALIFSILPATSFFARLGYFDHHIAEAFSLLLIFYALINTESDRFIKWVLLGVSFGTAMLFWQGSIIFVGLVFFILLFSNRPKAIIPFIAALLIILPFSTVTHYVDSPFSYRGLSLLHLSLLLIAILLLETVMLMRKKKIIALVPAGLLVIFVFILLQTRGFINGLFFIFKKDPWLATIMEFQPLIIQSGYLDNLVVKKTLGFAYYGWPLIAVLMFIENWKKDKIFIYFFIFVLFTGLMSFIGRRYVIWFLPFYTIGLGYLFKKVLDLFKMKVGLIISIAVFILNFLAIDTSIYKAPSNSPGQDEVKACKWVNDSTPPTSFLYEANKKPEYGIMCFWDSGHFLLYLGKRPVTSSNFGNDVPNFQKVNQFFLTSSEQNAIAMLNDFQTPYVYINGNIRNIYLASKYLEIDPKTFLNLYYTKDKTGKMITIMEPNENGINTTTFRLAQYLGSGFYYNDKFYPPYRSFRLRYFSGNIRIFEIVKGGIISGKTESYTPIVVTCEVNLPTVKFDYFDSLSADANGKFVISVPYPTYNSDYQLMIGGKKYNIHVSEENVKNGDTINIKF